MLFYDRAEYNKYCLAPAYEFLKSRWKALPTRQSLRDLGQLIIDSVPEDKRHEYGSPLSEGFNNLNFRITDVQEALSSHDFEGEYLTAVGKTEWWNIKWNDQSIAEKKTIVNEADLIFIWVRPK